MQENKKSGMLSFEDKLVIVGAGEVDTALLWRYARERVPIIAADGGADICWSKRIVPRAIIGDMDSLENKKEWEEKSRLIEVGEQESTDFEKCLELSEAPVTIGLGLWGRRVDHSLASLDVLLRHGARRKLAIASRDDVIIRARGRFEFHALPGSRISVFPVAPIRFSRSSGLEYPLDGLEMAPGSRTGVSNSTASGRFVIEPEEGESGPYLLVLERPNLEIWVRDTVFEPDPE